LLTDKLDQFGTTGTELVVGGGGGGGGGGPASILTALKLAKANTRHEHNLTFFIICSLLSSLSLNLISVSNVSQNENLGAKARHMPKKNLFYDATVSHLK
jgi:hypothetical protein